MCVIKHIQLSQFRHTLKYSLKWVPRSFWALNLNNGSWSMHATCSRKWKNAIHAPRCEGTLTSVGEKLAGLIQKKEDKIHLKLNTIKSVKACDAFPFSNKIIRVSYCAIAYMHTSLFLFPSCRHDSFRFSPSFFSFTIFYNLCKLSPVRSIGDNDFLRVISWACWYYHPLLVLVNYLLCYVAIYIC